MQDFYYRNELLARNSTGKLSVPAGADHQHKPDKLSDNSRADYSLFCRFFLSPMKVPAASPSWLVIDLNSIWEFKFYHKTSIMFIICELGSK